VSSATASNDWPTLLLVDDDPALCGALARALSRRGFAVSVAHDAETAAAVARSAIPEYAIVDLKMSGASGLTVIKMLRDLDAETRIVVLTGYASIATAVEAIKLGATHYLAKPADADEIVKALRRDEGDPQVAVAAAPLSVSRLEWEHLQKVLAEHDGNVSATARALNMHRRTLQRKLGKRPSSLS
jgi:two-component system, response regulator RegA